MYAGAGNGDYRGEQRQAVNAISEYVKAQSLSPSRAVVCLDGQYGNGTIVADLAGLSYVIRGKDDDLLDLESVQARLTQPPDQQTSYPETGRRRAETGGKTQTNLSTGMIAPLELIEVYSALNFPPQNP